MIDDNKVDEPLKQVKPRKKRVIEPSSKMVKYIINKEIKGMTKKDSAEEAGYAPSVANNVKTSIEAKDSYQLLKSRINDHLREYGINDKKIAQRLSEGIDAKRADGNADHSTRLSFINRVIDLRKDEESKPSTLNLTQVNLGELSSEDRTLMLQRLLRS